jgi:DNA polymerase III subunit delta
MAIEKIFSNIKKGIIAPCYLLYGEEEYLISEALQQILDAIIPEADRDFGLFLLDGENTDFDNLMDNLLTPSLLGGRKVIVIRNTTIFQSRENLTDLISKIRVNMDEHPQRAAKYFLTFLKLAGFAWEDMQDAGWAKITDEQWYKIAEGDTGNDRAKWLPKIIDICISLGLTSTNAEGKVEKLGELLLRGVPAGNSLILTAEAVDKRKKIFKIIAETGEIVYFGKKIKESEQRENLIKEARKLLQKYNKNLTAAAWIVLGKKTGWDLRRSLAEIEKLIFFTADRQIIEEKDVEEIVGKTKEDSIFDLTSALGEKNQLVALTALKSLLDQGMHHLMILSMLVREIRLLLQARILVDTKKLPLSKINMEFGLFQKTIYPTLTELAESFINSNNLIFSQHPYVIYNVWRNCGYFSRQSLINFLDELVEIDLAFKSSATDPQFILESFLIKVCSKH